MIIKYANTVIEYAVYAFVLAMLVSTSLWQLAMAALFFAWFAKHVVSRGRELDYLRQPLMAAGLIFCATVLVSTFYAFDIREGLRVYKNTIGAAVILLLAIPDVFRDEERQRRLLYVLACSAVGVTLLQLGRYGVDYLRDGSIRNYSHYRKMAEPLVIYLPFALALVFLHEKMRTRAFWASVVILQAGLLLATGARGAWAGVMVMLFVWLILKPEKKFILIFTCMTAMVSLALLVLDTPLVHRIGEGIMSATTLERLERLWPQAYEMIVARPIAGYGYGDYYGELLRQSAQHPEWVVLRPGPYGPHNNYLETWFSAGIVALVSLIYLCAKLFSQLVTVVRLSVHAPTAYFALATLCAFTAHFLVRGFVEDMNWRPLGVLAGIAVVLSLNRRAASHISHAA